MAKGFYVQEGKIIDYHNDGEADIAYCDVVPLASRIGVAMCDIPKGGRGSLSVSGVYELPADTAGMAVGQAVYWDTAAGKVVADAGEEATAPCGFAVAEKAEGTASVLVSI